MATRGRLSTSVKRTLTLATLGWLIAVTDPQPKPDERPRGGSGIVTPRHEEEKNLTLINIKREDDEILTLLNIFLQCRK